MGMLSACIYVEASEQFAAETVLRKHTANGVLDKALRVLGTDHCRRVLTLSTWIARVCENNPVSPFFTSHSNFFCIYYDYMISAIYVRAVGSFVFTTKNVRYLACHATQYLGICVYYNPTFLHCCLVGVACFIAIVIHFY